MARLVYEGKTRVAWVPAIASIAAPTTAELNAGTLITPYLTKDGLQRPASQNLVDNATLAETFDAQAVGSWGGSLQLTLFRDDATDTAWNLFVYGTTGFLVVRDLIDQATAWASTQKVEVYPSQMHNPTMQQTAANEMKKFTAMLAVTAQPNLKAAVA